MVEAVHGGSQECLDMIQVLGLSAVARRASQAALDLVE
jgi:hypothetical protein